MVATDPVVDAVKTVVRARLRERGWTYRDLAEAVGVSEVTIKRWMTGDDLSLGRVARLAQALGLTGFELLRVAEVGQERCFTVSERVETALAADADAHVAWDALRLGRSPEQVRCHYGHPRPAWFLLLGRLEVLGLVERHPEDRVRVLHVGIHSWLVGGPLQRRYRESSLGHVRQAWEADGSALHVATRVVGLDFFNEAEAELLTLARRWRDRAWRDQVSLPPERQRRVRWTLVLSEAPDWPEVG